MISDDVMYFFEKVSVVSGKLLDMIPSPRYGDLKVYRHSQLEPRVRHRGA